MKTYRMLFALTIVAVVVAGLPARSEVARPEAERTPAPAAAIPSAETPAEATPADDAAASDEAALPQESATVQEHVPDTANEPKPAADSDPAKSGTAKAEAGEAPVEPALAPAPGRFFTARAYPLTAVLGIVNLDGNVALTRNLTLGPALRLTKFNVAIYSESAFGLGLRGGWYARGPFSPSFYVAPTVLVHRGDASVETFIAGARFAFARVTMELIAGYQWHADQFSVAAGLGGSWYSTRIKDLEARTGGSVHPVPGRYSGNFIFPSAELALGWSF